MSREIALVYTSRTVRPNQFEDLHDILQVARLKNAASAITGVLLFDGERYLQFLEGDPVRIYALFERIQQDGRHEDVRLLAIADITERHFGNWNMGVIYPEQREVNDLAAMKEILEAEPVSPENRSSHDQALALLHGFSGTRAA
ncbi:MAG: BLUF domain-containing protein [Planctomycetota bacterium]